MAETTKTQSACKVAIIDILEARQMPQPDAADVLLTSYGEIIRANVIAAVVNIQEGDALLLDDGTGRILIRNVSQQPDVRIGDIVLCVGRPQRFQQEWYLVPDVLKKVDRAWMLVRKKELALRRPVEISAVGQQGTPVETETIKEPQEAVLENPLESRVVKMVKQQDKGDGADEGEIVGAMNHPMTEQLLQKMILRGDLFYVKPGRLKVLE